MIHYSIRRLSTSNQCQWSISWKFSLGNQSIILDAQLEVSDTCYIVTHLSSVERLRQVPHFVYSRTQGFWRKWSSASGIEAMWGVWPRGLVSLGFFWAPATLRRPFLTFKTIKHWRPLQFEERTSRSSKVKQRCCGSKALKRKLIAVAETLSWFNFNDD